ncbi:MAG: lipid-A-disaccharide synthase N-terminal domain-containing protein [Myxococcota bacterium]
MNIAQWFDNPWELLGWLGLVCYFSRSLIQWIASERAGDSVAPLAFWWVSVAGAVLLSTYSIYRAEPIFLIGYLITLGIYLRNLWILRVPGSFLSPLIVTLLAVIAWALVVTVGLNEIRPGYGDSLAWLGVAVVGQTLWSSRFIVQWYLSERAGESHIPEAFWWISLGGNALMLAYALRVGDPVWIAGLLLGPVVQIRNLMILNRLKLPEGKRT